jgi:hypothetical protein
MEVKDDVKLRTRKLAVFVTCLGLAAAFPVLSSADKGGVPHSKKPCSVKKHHHKKPKPNNKGKKCGFNEGTSTTTTTPSTTTAPSTSTETETTTTTSTT